MLRLRWDSTKGFLQISKSPKWKYSKLLSWAWNLNLLFTVIGGKLNFKFKIVIWNIFLEIWRFEKHIALSEKKPPLLERRARSSIWVEKLIWKHCLTSDNSGSRLSFELPRGHKMAYLWPNKKLAKLYYTTCWVKTTPKTNQLKGCYWKHCVHQYWPSGQSCPSRT